MTWIFIIIAILSLACILLLITLFLRHEREARLRAAVGAAERSADDAMRQRRVAEQAAVEELGRKTEAITTLTADKARLQARIEALEGQAERDRQELEKLQASFRQEFRNLANDILEEKTKQFKTTNKEALDIILKPFRDNISQFRERVESIYSDENQQRGALKNEIRNLMELNKRITEETTNLTNALKGNSKVQGDWGELILETILDSSSLVKGVHYLTQENFKTEYDANVRPDVVLNLPGGKRIVIDSKVSLTSFVSYTECETEDDRARCLKGHIASVRKHVSELGAKSYQELVDSPDFVIMFVPNEPAFLAALQNDSAIWSDAYNKKVVVSSPTNLFALLKIVCDLWERDSQNKNALRIAEEGGKLYDKFVGFYETMTAMGKAMQNASNAYDKALTQLSTGPGSLTRRTEILRDLGVRTRKRLPAEALGGPDDDRDDEEPVSLLRE